MPEMQQKFFRGLSAAGFHHLAYTEWGTGSRTIICSHGLTRNGRDFDVLAADLATSLGARVICPDVAGRGRSQRLASPALYTYPQYLADMNALLARLDVETVEWIGTSMGGLIGMMLAAQPNSPITRLVVNDVGPFIPRAALERIGAYVGKDPLFPDLPAAKAFLKATYPGFGPWEGPEWEALVRTSVEERPGGFGLAYDPGIADIFRSSAIVDLDIWPLWQAIRCPVLVLRGAESDLLLAETAQRMGETGPRARLETIPGTGHAPALMDPAQVALVRQFLAA